MLRDKPAPRPAEVKHALQPPPTREQRKESKMKDTLTDTANVAIFRANGAEITYEEIAYDQIDYDAYYDRRVHGSATRSVTGLATAGTGRILTSMNHGCPS